MLLAISCRAFEILSIPYYLKKLVCLPTNISPVIMQAPYQFTENFYILMFKQ